MSNQNSNTDQIQTTTATNNDEVQEQQQTSNDARILGHVDEDNVSDLSRQRQIELEEEKKLKARHPCIQRPGSDFLQKRLQRGQKYFDSGDYNMAKASTNPNMRLPDGASPVSAIDVIN